MPDCLFTLMEERKMSALLTDTMPVKVGQKVVYRWHVGLGTTLSPAAVEERTGTVVDVQRRGTRTEIRVMGARGWFDVSRVVRVLQ